MLTRREFGQSLMGALAWLLWPRAQMPPPTRGLFPLRFPLVLGAK